MSDAAAHAPMAGLRGLVRPVRDLGGAIAFYRDGLGFAHEPSPGLGASADAALAAAWGCAPRAWARMRLGAQSLFLAACPPDAVRPPPDDGADDPRFQHIAVVARGIDAAWQRLLRAAPATTPISRDGPVGLPSGAGSVTACKFRDADGHPVELLAFPASRVPARWQAGSAPTLGIDHSAITVADANRSVAFYAAQLGLRPGARQTNRGPEQARLDGLDDAVVDVVALHPGPATPHLELLAYHPARAPAVTSGPRTCTVWDAAPGTACATFTDPDGHLGLLLPLAHAA